MFPSQDNATHHELAVDMEDWSGNRRFARWLVSSTSPNDSKLWRYRSFRLGSERDAFRLYHQVANKERMEVNFSSSEPLLWQRGGLNVQSQRLALLNVRCGQWQQVTALSFPYSCVVSPLKNSFAQILCFGLLGVTVYWNNKFWLLGFKASQAPVSVQTIHLLYLCSSWCTHSLLA